MCKDQQQHKAHRCSYTESMQNGGFSLSPEHLVHHDRGDPTQVQHRDDDELMVAGVEVVLAIDDRESHPRVVSAGQKVGEEVLAGFKL